MLTSRIHRRSNVPSGVRCLRQAGNSSAVSGTQAKFFAKHFLWALRFSRPWLWDRYPLLKVNLYNHFLFAVGREYAASRSDNHHGHIRRILERRLGILMKMRLLPGDEQPPVIATVLCSQLAGHSIGIASARSPCPKHLSPLHCLSLKNAEAGIVLEFGAELWQIGRGTRRRMARRRLR